MALPLAEDFATLAADEGCRLRFHELLRKDRHMASVIDLFRDEFRAEGKAEGKAEGRILAILELVQAGDLPRDTAIVRLRHLAEQGVAPAAQIEAAIATLDHAAL